MVVTWESESEFNFQDKDLAWTLNSYSPLMDSNYKVPIFSSRPITSLDFEVSLVLNPSVNPLVIIVRHARIFIFPRLGVILGSPNWNTAFRTKDTQLTYCPQCDWLKKARQNRRMNPMRRATFFHPHSSIHPPCLPSYALPSFLALLTRLPNQPSSPWSSSPPFSPPKKLFKNRNFAAALPEHRLPPPLRRRRTFHLSPSSPFLVYHSSTSWLRWQHSKGAFVATFVVYTTWWVFSRFWVQACEQEEFGEVVVAYMSARHGIYSPKFFTLTVSWLEL